MKLKPKLYTIDEVSFELDLDPSLVVGLILKNSVPLFLKIEDLPLIARRWKVLERDKESYGVICAAGHIKLSPSDMYYEEIEIISRELLEADSIELFLPDKEFFNNFEDYNPPETPWKRNLEWHLLGDFELDRALDFEIALPEGLNAYAIATEHILIKRSGLEVLLEKMHVEENLFKDLGNVISKRIEEPHVGGTTRKDIRIAVDIFSEWVAGLPGELAIKDAEKGGWRLPGTYDSLFSALMEVCPELCSRIKVPTLRTYIKNDEKGSFNPIVILDGVPDKEWNWKEELNKIRAKDDQKNIGF